MIKNQMVTVSPGKRKQIDPLEQAIEVLDKKGLDAFVQQIHSKFEPTLAQDDKEKRFPGYTRRRWGGWNRGGESRISDKGIGLPRLK